MIKNAIQNAPAMAGVTIFMFGISVALTAVGALVPELWTTMATMLSVLMIALGITYFALNRAASHRSASFMMPKITIALVILTGNQRRAMAWAMA